MNNNNNNPVPIIKPHKMKEYEFKQSKYDVAPRIPFSQIVVGPSGSGKSILLQNMILDIYRDCFSRVFIFSASIHVDSVWHPVKDYIEKHLKVDTKKENIYFISLTRSKPHTLYNHSNLYYTKLKLKPAHFIYYLFGLSLVVRIGEVPKVGALTKHCLSVVANTVKHTSTQRNILVAFLPRGLAGRVGRVASPNLKDIPPTHRKAYLRQATRTHFKK